MKLISVYIDEEAARQLDAASYEARLPLSTYVREILYSVLKFEAPERSPRDPLRRLPFRPPEDATPPQADSFLSAKTPKAG